MTSYFSYLIKPRNDEIFSSWLRRGMASAHGQRFLLAQELLRERKVLDIDICPPADIISELTTILKLPKSQLSALFLSGYSWKHELPDRRYFCEYCVLDAIAAGDGMVIKKSWASYWYVTCQLHHTPMSYLQGRRAFSSANISHAILSNADDFRLLIDSYNSDHSASLRARYKSRRWSICGLVQIASATQHWLFNLFKKYEEMNDPAKFYEIVGVLKILIAVAARKRIKPFESKTLVSSVVPSARTVSCYYSEDADRLLDLTLDVNLSHADSSIRISTIAILGVALSLPRCTALWDSYISMPANELWAFRTIHSSYVRAVMFDSQYCNYDLVLCSALEKVDPDIRQLFRMLL